MKKSIDVGTCYRDSSVFWSRWRVDRIFANFLGMPHAVVVNLADPTESRTIACTTLSAPRRYCPIEPDEAGRTDPAFAIEPAVSGREIPPPMCEMGAAA